MDPNQNPQNSLDYLNSISTPQPVKTMNPLALWGLIGGAIVVVIVAVALLFGSAGPSNQDKFMTLAYQLKSLQSLSADNQKNIQSSELRRINSSLTISVSNANQSIADTLSAENVKVAEDVPKDSDVKTEFDELASDLDDARLNATFDRRYAREMAFLLQKLDISMQELYEATSQDTPKTFLDSTYKNLQPLQKQFSKFNASDG